MKRYTLQKTDDNFVLKDDTRRTADFRELTDGATVIAFHGGMGAGKTTLIKQICKALGTKDVVNSPTFAIVNVYEADNAEIYHFDCYRLNNLQEALDFGAEEYLTSGNLCLVEWPDVISALLPEDTRNIHIEEEAGARSIIID